MSSISVRQTTQKIVVDAATGAVSVISAGAQGPAGPAGELPITFGDTPPVAPNIEDLWVNTDTFTLHGYYNDGDSVQWVEIGSIDVADFDVAALADLLVPYVLNDPDFEDAIGGGGSGDNTPPTGTVSTTTHTLDLADKARLTVFDNASQVTVTVPTATFENGDWFAIQSSGAGGITFDTTGLTVIGESPLPDLSQYHAVTIIYTAADTVTFYGISSGGGEAVDPTPTKNTVAATGATETLTEDDVQDITMDADCTFTFPTPTNDIHVMTVELYGAFNPTWPGSVAWVGGAEPTYVPGNVYLFYTSDTGASWLGALYGGAPVAEPFSFTVAASNETTAISATGTKMTFRAPHGMNLTEVRASLTGACTTGTFTVDVNEDGASIFSTTITVDATEKTSTTAATPAVLADTAIADDAEITIDVDDVGDGTATGLKVTFKGTRA